MPGLDSLASLLDQPPALLRAVRETRRRVVEYAIETPLLAAWRGRPRREVRLKLESLQPTGSFKVRGSANAVLQLEPGELADGVWTASAGNFAQGLAWAARQRGVGVRVHAPDTAAAVKLEAIRAYGAAVIVHTFAEWWRIVGSGTAEQERGRFVHPFADLAVILGNATIALEMIESWPELDTIVAPFGGGGLIVGLALAAKALRPDIRIVACESAAATPLASAWTAGQPVRVDFDTSTFITGIGSTSVLPPMWPFLRKLVDAVVVVPVQEVEEATRSLGREHHLIVEGAGAAAVAAAMREECGGTHVAAVVSGGNMDPSVFARLMTPVVC